MRILSIGFLLLASAFTAQACTYCQCEFEDGSHCCVYSDATQGNLDCPSVCKNAHRADGKTSDDGMPGTACNAGGKYKCASAFTALDRTPCYKQ